mgnify:CR=1 FL=1
MTIREYIITADENKWLTQKEDVGDNNRLYTKELRLGKFDSSDNWRDADDAEKVEYEKRMEEEARKEHPNEP